MPIQTNRITSEDLVLRWLPLAEVDTDVHTVALAFDSAVDGGTFKLWVNGEETAAITVDETVAGTTITNIQAALDALDGLAADELVVAGTYPAITITAAAVGFYRVQVVEGFQDTLTQTTSNNNKKLQLTVTAQGSEWFLLTNHASAFNYETSTDVVELSAYADRQTFEKPTRSSMSFSITCYDAGEEWQHSIFDGAWGLIEAFPRGMIVGQPYMRFRALVGTVGKDFPDADAVEISIDGTRQGNFHVYPDTIYKG